MRISCEKTSPKNTKTVRIKDLTKLKSSIFWLAHGMSHWRSGIFVTDFDAPKLFGNFLTHPVPKCEESCCWRCAIQARAAVCNSGAVHYNFPTRLVCDLCTLPHTLHFLAQASFGSSLASHSFKKHLRGWIVLKDGRSRLDKIDNLNVPPFSELLDSL